MEPSSRTPEGWSNRCPVCGKNVCIAPSTPPGDAPCPHCGHLLWFDPGVPDGTEAKRGKRLDKCFQHATKQANQGNYDYATTLFAQCALSAPSNAHYVRSYVENLRKKFGNNRERAPLAQFDELGAGSAIEKATNASQWGEVLQHGLKILAVNPWSVETLRQMATASGQSGDYECELVYLKCALEAKPNDLATNKQCANALADRDQFDQAIACWHRVEQTLPNDEEAQRAITALTERKALLRPENRAEEDAYDEPTS